MVCHAWERLYFQLNRHAWSGLQVSGAASLTESELGAITGLGEPVDVTEMEEVYLPLAQLLLHQRSAWMCAREAELRFLGQPMTPTPFVVAIAGSVAAGKSTTARVLRELLVRSDGNPRVELVATDGFLLPNKELERRGLLQRKGWPESYDTGALLAFLLDVEAGVPEVHVPTYSHLTYDIVPGQPSRVRLPDILLVEGLTLLQPALAAAHRTPDVVVSDFFDTSLYVPADERDLREWYARRFLALRNSAFSDPSSYFHAYSSMDEEAALETAHSIWEAINRPNLLQNILPTRARAAIVLEKDHLHRMHRMLLRRP